MSLPVDTSKGFWHVYIADIRSVVVLVVVCCFIAALTNAINGMGYFLNLAFSFSYGFPISMIETFFRVRNFSISEFWLNALSVLLGGVVGSLVVYGYLIYQGIVEFGSLSFIFVFNFGFGFAISAVAYYFFWSRYRNQALTLALRDQQLKAAEFENLKQQAENRLLQSQMEPHFLFNTLANIQSLIDIDAAAAKTMVADLSQMLRASLAYSSQEFCTVEQELLLVRSYLNIQTVRIGERLHVAEQVDESVLSLPMLPMTLQPLVENAIKHGIEPCVGQCSLSIRIAIVDDKLELSVENGCDALGVSKQGHGISLKNIQQRLSNSYGQAANFQAGKTQQGWLSKVTLPVNSMAEKL